MSVPDQTIDDKLAAKIRQTLRDRHGCDLSRPDDQVKFLASLNTADSLANSFLDGSTTASTADSRDSESANSILRQYLALPSASAVSDLTRGHDEYKQPLAAYYISSSHNTYLQHSQLIGDASVQVYRDVLESGCRCVEIDVWNGKGVDEDGSEGKKAALKRRMGSISKRLGHLRLSSKSATSRHSSDPTVTDEERVDETEEPGSNPSAAVATPKSTLKEPRVLHGHTLTKEVSFRAVCEAIRDSAFVASDLPVIVSLEVHCNAQGQQMMVDIMQHTWEGMLVDTSDAALQGLHDLRQLPSPDDMRRKILIKVKYTPPDKAITRKLSEPADSNSPRDDESIASVELSDEHDEDEDESPETTGEQPVTEKQQTRPSKKKKGMLQALSRLGVYTRAYHFKSFDQPEASQASHVFSLSEGALAQAHLTVPRKLFEHNRRFLMRCYPRGTRVLSTNLNPVPFWRRGVQMAALNMQSLGKSTMLNAAMFADSGGFVLKPAGYRFSESLAEGSLPGGPHRALDLALDILALSGLQSLTTSKRSLHPYLIVSIHTEGLISERILYKPASGRRSSVSASGAADALAASAASMDRSLTVEKGVAIEKSAGVGLDRVSSNDSRRSSVSVDASGQIDTVKLKQRSATVKADHSGVADFTETATITFEDVEVDSLELCFLRIKVMNNIELKRDELLGWACVRLDRLKQGLRVLDLQPAKIIAAGGDKSLARMVVDIRMLLRQLSP